MDISVPMLQITGTVISAGAYLLESRLAAPRQKLLATWVYVSVACLTIAISVISSANVQKESARRLEDQNRVLSTIKKSIFKLDGMTVSYTLEIPADNEQYQAYGVRMGGKIKEVVEKITAFQKKKFINRSVDPEYSISGVKASNIYTYGETPVIQEIQIEDKSPLFPKDKVDGGICPLLVDSLNFVLYKTPLALKDIPSFTTFYGGYDIDENYVPVKDYKRPVWDLANNLETNERFSLNLVRLSSKNRKFYYALNGNMYVETNGLITEPQDAPHNPNFTTLDDLSGAALYMGSSTSIRGGSWHNFDGKIIELSFTIKNGPEIFVDCSKIQTISNSDGTKTYSYVFPSNGEEFNKLIKPSWPKWNW